MEAILSVVSWKAAAGVVAAAWAAWRAKKVKKAWEKVNDLVKTIENARSESSPAGKKWTQAEIEEVGAAAGEAIQALAPVLSRLFSRK